MSLNSDDAPTSSIDDLAYLLSLTMKMINPCIDQDATAELLSEMLSNDLTEHSAILYGTFIASTSGTPHSQENH